MSTVEAWPVLTARAGSRGGQTWIPPPTLLTLPTHHPLELPHTVCVSLSIHLVSILI